MSEILWSDFCLDGEDAEDRFNSFRQEAGYAIYQALVQRNSPVTIEIRETKEFISKIGLPHYKLTIEAVLV